ncbi:type VII secretion integral membrane protein EccD [Rhodococcus sp. 06-470-2]|uniref:type VII secretion integral membrane protein EccD n=1 Tax=unclassified Rhodococcus (in: high G+C Gram-positive bacteria) TaxID=192944 RepID=UPI000B9B40D8|nr:MULTISPECIES: type VII secretion integral membrane protein EccD [unclassified Rhodococcus (in: high G+C Gram-positive bacteria)]OZC56534.1 type VII secretion integral membrane protein EccD [Rhodococcus sp. 06-470-2]OZE54055.1 type VII secretion integral membrane protein EccD [Rhodococcus sp. 05-2221-1B]
MTRADSRPSAGIVPPRTAPADPTQSPTAPDASRRASGAQSVFAQDVCRVTVLARSTQVDMALPIDVPVSLLVPGIVDMIAAAGVEPAERPGRAGVEPAERPGRAGVEPAERPGRAGVRPGSGGGVPSDGDPVSDGLPVAWTLARIGFPPLSPTATLSELSVRDGELLVLGVAERPAPVPLFDDLMYSVARSGSDDVRQWTARTARTVGSVVTGLSVLVACAVLAREPIRAGAEHVGSVVEGFAAVTASILFAIAGVILGRVYDQYAVAVVFGGCAVALMFTGGTVLVPGQFGAAQLMLGSAMAGAVALLSLRIGGTGFALFTAAILLAVLTFAASVCALFTTVPQPSIGTAVALTGLAGIALSARVSMMQAKLPLPPVPTAGAPLDTVEEAELDAISFADLQASAAVARSCLSGLLSAFTVAVVAGVLVAAAADSDGGVRWPGVALAGLCALVLLLRGRTYAVVTHAVPLVAGGTTILLALSIGALVALPEHALALFGAALAGAVTASIFGAFVPTRTYSPVMRRSAELLEYAAIALVIPIAVWVCGLYSVVRGL